VVVEYEMLVDVEFDSLVAVEQLVEVEEVVELP